MKELWKTIFKGFLLAESFEWKTIAQIDGILGTN